jgi:hypothetical protein
VDQKQIDAIELCHQMEMLGTSDAICQSSPITFSFSSSSLFNNLYNRDREVRCEGTQLPLYEISEYAALHAAGFDRINESALNRALVLNLANLLQVTASPDDVETEMASFKTSRRINSDISLLEWLGKNHLSRVELEKLVEQLAIGRKMQRWYLVERSFDRNIRKLLNELRLSGDYPRLAAEAALCHHVSTTRLASLDDFSPVATDLSALAQEHIDATGAVISGDLAEWSFFAGFRTMEDLRVALRRSKETRRFLKEILDGLQSGVSESPGDPGTQIVADDLPR